MTRKEWLQERREMREYRIANFDVDVQTTDHPTFDDEITISVTRNGTAWQSLSVSPDEWRKIKEAVEKRRKFRE